MRAPRAPAAAAAVLAAAAPRPARAPLRKARRAPQWQTPELTDCAEPAGAFSVNSTQQPSPCGASPVHSITVAGDKRLFGCDSAGGFLCTGDGSSGAGPAACSSVGMLGCASTLQDTAFDPDLRTVYAVCGTSVARCDWDQAAGAASNCATLAVGCPHAPDTVLGVLVHTESNVSKLLLSCMNNGATWSPQQGLLACDISPPGSCAEKGHPCRGKGNVALSWNAGKLVVGCSMSGLVYCDFSISSGATGCIANSSASPCYRAVEAVTALPSGKWGVGCFPSKYFVCGVARPTVSPTAAPSVSPSPGPSPAPSTRPTTPPSVPPSLTPAGAPSATPTCPPTAQPRPRPTAPPSAPPSVSPAASTAEPSEAPTAGPRDPTTAPAAAPSRGPTAAPSGNPTGGPSTGPTSAPSAAPSSAQPSAPPTAAPAPPTSSPAAPTGKPAAPSSAPATAAPTAAPARPTVSPAAPTDTPTVPPVPPTGAPASPTAAPTTAAPTQTPAAPTAAPAGPTEAPAAPTTAPSTAVPTRAPAAPTAAPSARPTEAPAAPTTAPAPTAPTQAPAAPTAAPAGPTEVPAAPTTAPSTAAPTNTPTAPAVVPPTGHPSTAPAAPTVSPAAPTGGPTARDTAAPVTGPTAPRLPPSARPSRSPSEAPTAPHGVVRHAAPVTLPGLGEEVSIMIAAITSSELATTALAMTDVGCADTAAPRSLGGTLHPTGLRVGGSEYVGCLCGAALVVGSVGALTALALAVLRNADADADGLLGRDDLQRSCLRHLPGVKSSAGMNHAAVVRHPSIALAAGLLLYQGLSFSALAMLVSGREPGGASAAAWHRVLGGVAAAALLALPLGIFQAVRRGLAVLPRPDLPAGAPEARARVRMWDHPAPPRWLQWALVGEGGDWVSRRRSRHWVNSWKSAVRVYAATGAAAGLLAELAAAFALSLVGAVPVRGWQQCGHARAASAAVHSILLVFVALRRPYRCLRDTLLRALMQGLLGAGLICVAASFYRAESEGEDEADVVLGQALVDGAAALLLVQVAARAAAGLLTWLKDWRFRSQALEWAECHAADGGGSEVKPAEGPLGGCPLGELPRASAQRAGPESAPVRAPDSQSFGELVDSRRDSPTVPLASTLLRGQSGRQEASHGRRSSMRHSRLREERLRRRGQTIDAPPSTPTLSLRGVPPSAVSPRRPGRRQRSLQTMSVRSEHRPSASPSSRPGCDGSSLPDSEPGLLRAATGTTGSRGRRRSRHAQWTQGRQAASPGAARSTPLQTLPSDRLSSPLYPAEGGGAGREWGGAPIGV
eukprot:TRINITY_DN14442_c0_g1_i8.p1 TRINITY_DN14442_c0_g1~~TRINITY_DN14442_c0_g1_i8.p1  ORF type:complete len:1315 (+),score=204.30 TRINITY_DN14442_c0_g1_i8:81-3947(+)